MKNVAVIGVGYMGKGIVRNLILKGLQLVPNSTGSVLNRLSLYDNNAAQIESLLELMKSETCQIIADKRLQIVENPKDVLLHSDMVALSLPSEDICHRILFDKDEGIVNQFAREQKILSPGRRIIVDHGTYSREFVLHCHERIQKTVHNENSSASLSYVDAPVSGGPQGAWNGTLSIMAGGEKVDIDAAEPVLSLYSSRCEHFGDVGKAVSRHFYLTLYIHGVILLFNKVLGWP